jgi:hypothetical protein
LSTPSTQRSAQAAFRRHAGAPPSKLTPDPAEAERIVTGAGDYIAAIEAMLDK